MLTIKYPDTSLSVFDERDEIRATLYNDKDGSSILDLWNEDLLNALENDSIKVGRKSISTILSDDDEVLHRSMYDYAVDMGIIKGE
jgi:hypothetical protein